MQNHEQLINLKEEITQQKTSFSHEEQIIPQQMDSEQYIKQVNSINFQAQSQNLLDLAEDPLMSSSMIKNYQEFLFNRQIQIGKPQLIQQGIIISYKLYKIKSKKKLTNKYDTIVERRFNDFQFLHYQLIENYGGCIIPKLPDKSIWASLNLQTQQFQEIRIRQMQKYVQNLLRHERIRYSKQVKRFLFESDPTFSLNKGEYIEKTSTLQNQKNLSSNIYGLGKHLYNKFTTTTNKVQFSINNQEEIQLKLFEREIEDLMRISTEVKQIILSSHRQIELLYEIQILSNIKLFKKQKLAEQFVVNFSNFIDQFDDICCFIYSCNDAINRTKTLKLYIQQLLQEQDNILNKQKINPRNRQLDIIRSKIQKAKVKAERWTSSLLKELQIYTKEGKTLLEGFIIDFTKLKAQIYSSC